MPPITIEIPQAAAGRPYSKSTLRNYVRAWSEIYGALPRSRPRGNVLLVAPLIAVFDKAHALRANNGLSTIKKRLVRVLDDDASALPNIAVAYSELLDRTEMVGVAVTVARLQTQVLKRLAAGFQDLQATQRANKMELSEEIDIVFRGAYSNLASLLGEQAHTVFQVNDLLSAFATYLARTEKTALELAAMDSTAS